MPHRSTPIARPTDAAHRAALHQVAEFARTADLLLTQLSKRCDTLAHFDEAAALHADDAEAQALNVRDLLEQAQKALA